MRKSYYPLPPDEKSMDAGGEVARLLISKELSYKQATDALDYAQELLFNKAMAAAFPAPQQDD